MRPFRLFISHTETDIELFQTLSIYLTSNEIEIIHKDPYSESEDLRGQIMTELSHCDGILVLLTQNSVSLVSIIEEMEMALKLGKLFFPVIYGDIEIPPMLKGRQIIFWRGHPQEVVEQLIMAINVFRGTRPFDNETSPNNPNDLVQKRNYWMLKMDPGTWRPNQLKEGEETYFNTHFFGKRRPEFNQFEKVAPGDYVLGYVTGDIQAILFEKEVLTPASADVYNGEGFSMKITSRLIPQIPFRNFEGIFNEISAELRKYQNPGQLFFALNENQYANILAAIATAENPFSPIYRPFYLTEGNHDGTIDQLEFEEDINSFASVIALNSVKPPLAIGLFGNWGSGKSFFMDKLAARIDTIAKSNDENFVKNVVQVRFNSWHYSDTNLWASLTTQIFESLHNFATDKNYGDDAIQKIYKDLNITSYQLEETKRKIDFKEKEVSLLEEQKKRIEDDIDAKKEKLAMWNTHNLMAIVFSDPFIQDDFEGIKSQFEQEQLIENIGDINAKLSEVENVRGQLLQSMALLKENSKGKWWAIWIITAGFVLILILALGPLKPYIEEVIKGATIVTTSIVVWLTSVTGLLAPYFNKIKLFYKRLKSLKGTIEKRKAEVKLQEDHEILKLGAEINKLETDKQNLLYEQEQAENKKIRLQEQLKEIGSGKMLTTFLEGRTADDAYIKQLGIISWIRKDFAKLNELFKNQKTVQSQEKDLKAEVEIDRIVLYIDDLDRCNEEIVIKVLEAIHLLLAFELFVVVVGVDPRWLNNALSEKYKSLFGKKQNTGTNLADTVPVENGLTEHATSYDYLEKIFQIPFALKPINNSGREKLIGYLVKDEMEELTSAGVPEVSETQTIAFTDSLSEDIIKTVPIDNIDDTPKKDDDLTQKNTKKRLVFSKPEITYMQQIAPIFGKTPRTINRYVNIYRIIKAHGNLKASVEFSKRDFMPIMYLLAIIVGHSVHAKELLLEILKADENESLLDFIARVEWNDKLKMLLDDTSSEIQDFQMKDFIKNLELISRFSFRTLIVDH